MSLITKPVLALALSASSIGVSGPEVCLAQQSTNDQQAAQLHQQVEELKLEYQQKLQELEQRLSTLEKQQAAAASHLNRRT
jgi:small-conductance mechanosensitive channel